LPSSFFFDVYSIDPFIAAHYVLIYLTDLGGLPAKGKLSMMNIVLEQLQQNPVGRQRLKLVERKGTGHPDSICDAVMEEDRAGRLCLAQTGSGSY